MFAINMPSVIGTCSYHPPTTRYVLDIFHWAIRAHMFRRVGESRLAGAQEFGRLRGFYTHFGVLVWPSVHAHIGPESAAQLHSAASLHQP